MIERLVLPISGRGRSLRKPRATERVRDHLDQLVAVKVMDLNVPVAGAEPSPLPPARNQIGRFAERIHNTIVQMRVYAGSV